jgi:hypothetical protein
MKFDRASLAICILLSAAANAQDWQPVTGQAALTEIVSDSRLEGTLKGDVTGVARYSVSRTTTRSALKRGMSPGARRLNGTPLIRMNTARPAWIPASKSYSL